MKVYITVDENKIVRCLATERNNIHKDKKHLSIYHVEGKGTVGDEYDTKTKKWTAKPENYPTKSEAELNEIKITQEIKEMAIKSLQDKGELPEDYEEK